MEQEPLHSEPNPADLLLVLFTVISRRSITRVKFEVGLMDSPQRQQKDVLQFSDLFRR